MMGERGVLHAYEPIEPLDGQCQRAMCEWDRRAITVPFQSFPNAASVRSITLARNAAPVLQPSPWIISAQGEHPQILLRTLHIESTWRRPGSMSGYASMIRRLASPWPHMRHELNRGAPWRRMRAAKRSVGARGGVHSIFTGRLHRLLPSTGSVCARTNSIRSRLRTSDRHTVLLATMNKSCYTAPLRYKTARVPTMIRIFIQRTHQSNKLALSGLSLPARVTLFHQSQHHSPVNEPSGRSTEISSRQPTV